MAGSTFCKKIRYTSEIPKEDNVPVGAEYPKVSG